MKYYGSGICAWFLILAAIVVLVIRFYGQTSERLNQTQALREELAQAELQHKKQAIQLDEARDQSDPHRRFLEVWSPHLQDLNAGSVFQALDRLAFELGLATGRKGTASRNATSVAGIGRRTMGINLTLTGDHRQILSFLNHVASAVPLLRIESLRMQSAVGQTVELRIQSCFPLL